MTAEEILLATIAEVERLMKENVERSDGSQFYGGRASALGCVLSFMDSMQKEPASKELQLAYQKYADHQIERVYPDLNSNLPRHSRMSLNVFDGTDIELAFEKGANWQRQKDNQDESDMAVVAYMDGVEKGKAMMRAQIMKEAKSGVGNKDNYIQVDDGTWIDLDPSMSLTPAFHVEEGEKVKVIVIKED